jgi:hypothetical protein
VRATSSAARNSGLASSSEIIEIHADISAYSGVSDKSAPGTSAHGDNDASAVGLSTNSEYEP